jgi:hypothetical protein
MKMSLQLAFAAPVGDTKKPRHAEKAGKTGAARER